MKSVLLFGGSLIFMCLAHFVRILRQELFIDIYEQPNRRELIRALSLGYVLNFIFPFKIGEFFRAWYAGKQMKNGKALGFSVVIVDRYLDIISVGFVFFMLSLLGIDKSIFKQESFMYFLLAAILLVVAMIIYVGRGTIKKFIRVIASIFNERIESAILAFAWALIWNFKDIFLKIRKSKLFLTTLGMWLSYLMSYFFFSSFLNELGGRERTTWIDIFMMLFNREGVSGNIEDIILYSDSFISIHPFYIIGYMVIPVLIILAISFVFDAKLELEGDNYLKLLPHMDARERLAFLENYFSNNNADYIRNYLRINRSVSIIRDYSAGSNATTMLCIDGDRTIFRKYALGEDGEKLYQQVLWIKENKDRLALPSILKEEKTDTYCFYDMPYSSNSVGLFEYVHSVPIELGWSMIERTLKSLENTIYQTNCRNAEPETIYQYINSKVIKNIEKIKKAKQFKQLQQYDTIIINGVAYKNLSFYKKYLNEDYLYNVFSKDTYAVIHGDLTIENIICTRNEKGNDDFYIIDPNTGNIHESPNLDYGKLLQSIHGGYEFLMSTKDVKIVENRLSFLSTKSSVYMELHAKLREYMQQEFGNKRTKSIYFHEIIHWLRLMPYKIEKDGNRALLFYAGMLMVMNDVIELYGDLENE